MDSLGERIKLRRGEKKITAAELARRADISKGYLSEIETGAAPKPSADVLFRIATALGTSMADLLGKQPVLSSSRSVPANLAEFAQEAGIPAEDVEMLANIRFRGEQPKSKDDWRFLYDAIKRSVR